MPRAVLIFISGLLVFCMQPLPAQSYLYELGLWKQRSLTGKATMEGIYRRQKSSLFSGMEESISRSRFNGNFELNSSSIVWHPNFLQLDIGIQYNPTLNNETFLVMPERTETLTAEQYRFSAAFFNRRPLILQFFGTMNQMLINREYTTDVESNRNDIGATLSYKNGFLPFSVKVNRMTWDQKEKRTSRQFKNTRSKFQLNASESFAERDNHSLTYYYEDYQRDYADYQTIRNYMHGINLEDMLRFGTADRGLFRSMLWFHDLRGSEEWSRLHLNESVTASLPSRFRFSGNYNFRYFDYSRYLSRQHQLNFRLEHQLYQSLNSHLHQEYTNLNHTHYQDDILQTTAGFDYRKNILLGGRLSLKYEYRIRKDERESPAGFLRIFNEEYTLRDDEVVLLNNPDVDPASVKVKDETGTIIFDENMDYLIIRRGPYLEIQRLPGGQIEEGDIVYIDYLAEQRTSFQYTGHGHRFGTAIHFLDDLFRLYYRHFRQDYSDADGSAGRILRTASRNVWGMEVSRYSVSLGIEIEDYNSNIIPFSLKRYRIGWNKVFSPKSGVNLDAGIRKYYMTGQDEKNDFADLSGQAYYLISSGLRLNFRGGYRMQEGRNRDLNLANVRSELQYLYRESRFTMGYEFYYRDFVSDRTTYNGGYLRYERMF